MEILGIGILVFAAALLGTVSGFGIGPLMVPVLATFYSFPQVLLFVGIIHLLEGLWRIVLFRQGINWKIILAFGITATAASFLGASISIQAQEVLLKHILGFSLIAYAVSAFFKPNFALPKNSKTLAAGGVISGFTAGFLGVDGGIIEMFISAFNLPKAVFLATSGFLELLVDASRVVTYIGKGVRLWPFFLWGFIVFVPLSFLGAKIGQKIVRKIPQNKFRRVVAAFLLLAGLYLIFG